MATLWLKYADAHVRVSGEDLRRINKTSIPLPGEDDTYWGTLGVVHELHCLVNTGILTNMWARLTVILETYSPVHLQGPLLSESNLPPRNAEPLAHKYVTTLSLLAREPQHTEEGLTYCQDTALRFSVSPQCAEAMFL